MTDRIRDRLNALLTEFRSEEPAAPEWLANPETLAVLRAWTRVPAEIGEPLFLCQPQLHRHNRWTYAWKYRRVDHARLAREAGVSENSCRDLFIRLVAARLIYPDGSLARSAGAVLAAANN